MSENIPFVSDLFRSYEQDVISFIKNFNQQDVLFLTYSKCDYIFLLNLTIIAEKEDFSHFIEKNFVQTERSVNSSYSL